MTANNEIGTIAPVAEIGRLAHEHGVLFHTDAAQAVGHIPMDVEQMGIDILSLSGHKVCGPKGIGALYIRRRNPKVKLSPVVFGGGQERGYRSGTLNIPGIVGLGRALEIADREMAAEERRFRAWTTEMLEAFREMHSSVLLNGHPTERLAHNLNICLEGIESKAIIHGLRDTLAISSGSACTTMNVEPSHVLLATGRTEQQAHSSLRFGVGRFTTDSDIDTAIVSIGNQIAKLSSL
ncbi:Cysteine desulfurase IscS [anaerobic digester metagenome]